VMDRLATADPEKVQFVAANSLWTKITNPDYAKDVEKSFSAEVLPLNTHVEINKWVAKKTKDMIKEVVQELKGTIVCVLVNAIYFRGFWSRKFDSKDTLKREVFHDFRGNQKSKCDLMTYGSAVSFPIAAGKSPQIEYVVELPYGKEKFSMLVFLPAVGADRTSAVEAAMDMCKKKVQLSPKKILLWLPKFKVEWSGGMVPILKELGISSIFDKGHLAKVGPEDTYVSDVLHKAVIEVDEEGTKAAAVTVAVLKSRSMVMHDEPPEIRFDRPFVLVIQSCELKLPIFVGYISL